MASVRDCLRNHTGHLLAGCCAASADFRATLHHLVIAKSLTIFCAARTDLGTDTACLRMELGHSEHEVRAGLTDLGAVHH